MKNDERLRHVLPLPRSGKPADLTPVFTRVQREWVARPLPQPAQEITLQVALSMKHKPVRGARLVWRLPGGSALAMTGTKVTGSTGRAVASVEPERLNGVDHLRLDITLPDGETLEFADIALVTTGLRTYTGPGGISVTVAGVADRLPPLERPKPKKKRFRVALAGTVPQLEKVLPLFVAHECFQVDKVLVKGKAKSRIDSLPAKAETVALDASLVEALTNIEVLFDFSGSPAIRKLEEAQRAGEPKVKTIIAPECAHLTEQAGALLALRQARSPIEEVAGDAME